MSELQSVIEGLQNRLREGRFTSEAHVSQGIVLPILSATGWAVFDPEIVCPEFGAGTGRVDFAVCHPRRKPQLFIEVKQVGKSEGGDRQLFEYAFHAGVPLVVLTDGQVWNFYLPAGQGDYLERRIYKLDLLERTPSEAAERLQRYLSNKRVVDGTALASALAEYGDVARARDALESLPRAWNNVLREPDTILIELVSDEVETLCGYRPSGDAVAGFIATQLNAVGPRNNATSIAHPAREAPRAPIEADLAAASGDVGEIEWRFLGRTARGRSGREVLTSALELLAERDGEFLTRFAARPQHGRRRRYVAERRDELYPERPDLAESHAHQLRGGWWVGTNNSRATIEKILRMACEVAGLQYGRDLVVKMP